MDIGATTGASAVGTEGALNLTSGADNELDRNAFLRLLLAQLENQDPVEPIKDQAFVAQLAEFSSLERLEEIASSVETLVGLAQSQQQARASFDSASKGD